MKYAFANSLSSATSVLDPDAKSYINAVVLAGATVTPSQKNAINAFVKNGKSDGWYFLLKRMYLPVWGAASPNAICLTSLTSGTFVGSVLHSAGYVEHNGTNSYFSTSQAIPGMGLSFNDCSLGYGSLLDAAQQNGNRTGGVERFVVNDSGLNIVSAIPSTGVDAVLSSTPSTGHLIGTSTASNARAVYRVHSGGTQSTANTLTSTTGLANIAAFWGASNNNGTPSFSGAATIRHAFYHVGLGLSSTNVADFSASAKTLWESLTGLTLP